MRIALFKLTTEHVATDSKPTDIVFVGSRKDVESFAKKNKLEWMKRPQMMFGGYYIDRENGYCLIPEVV